MQLEALAFAVENAQQGAAHECVRGLVGVVIGELSDLSGERQPEALLQADGAGGQQLLLARGLRLNGGAEEGIHVFRAVGQLIESQLEDGLAETAGLAATQQAGAHGDGDGQHLDAGGEIEQRLAVLVHLLAAEHGIEVGVEEFFGFGGGELLHLGGLLFGGEAGQRLEARGVEHGAGGAGLQLGNFDFALAVGPDVVEDEQRLALAQPLSGGVALLIGREGLDVDGQALDQLRGDGVERALAAGLEDDGVEVFLGVPGELQGEGGLAGAGLAVEEEDHGLAGEGAAQLLEIRAATDEVLGAILGQSEEALDALALLEPGDGLAKGFLRVAARVDEVLGAQQLGQGVVAQHHDAEARLLLSHPAGQNGGPFLFGPFGGGGVGRPDEQRDIAPLEAFFNFADEIFELSDINLTQPRFGARADDGGGELLRKVGVFGAVREEDFHGAARVTREG
ncbi:MAG TPA: hypothetical protein VII23_05300 [Terriglobales bacterium]